MEDLSEPLALQYLEKRGVAAKAAAQVVDVTGGRLLQLMCAVELLQAGGTSEGVRAIALCHRSRGQILTRYSPACHEVLLCCSCCHLTRVCALQIAFLPQNSISSRCRHINIVRSILFVPLCSPLPSLVLMHIG